MFLYKLPDAPYFQTRSQKCEKAENNYLRQVCVPVCPRGTTRLPLDGFSLKLNIWVCFENVSRKFQFHLKNWQEQRVPYTKTCDNISLNSPKTAGTLHEDLWQYLAEFTKNSRYLTRRSVTISRWIHQEQRVPYTKICDNISLNSPRTAGTLHEDLWQYLAEFTKNSGYFTRRSVTISRWIHKEQRVPYTKICDNISLNSPRTAGTLHEDLWQYLAEFTKNSGYLTRRSVTISRW